MSSELLDLYLRPVPGPHGFASREIVRRAIEFETPPRIPYSAVMPLESDFFEVGFLRAAVPGLARPAGGITRPQSDGKIGEVYYDDWGVGHRVTGHAWDHAFDYPLQDLSRLDDYVFPDAARPEPYEAMAPYIHRAHEAGKYVVGFDHVLMFERMRALLGFEELMVAPYTQPEGLEALLQRLADLVVEVIGQWGRIGGVDAFMTWEDFGLQATLQMKLETFRQVYKPHYARIVAAAHQHGMHYIWHNCGYILDMIPDLIDIGVDVLQLDQPRLIGHEKLAQAANGRICYWNTVDIQWSTQEKGVTTDELQAEVAEMFAAFQGFSGGFMARQYPAPRDVNLSDEQHRVIYEAFLEQGCGWPVEQTEGGP
jgi:hypothetical protein